MHAFTRFARVAGGIATATTAGLAFTALPAQAATTATAAVVSPGGVRYDAGRGQANYLHITAQGRIVTFDDEVDITAGTGCTAVAGDPTQVTCDLGATPGALGLAVNLHDGDDVVINDSAIGMLGSGGAGNDTLLGSNTAADDLRGGDGDDSVQGRNGDNKVSGGDGDDQVAGGQGDDLLDGGAGNDTLYGYDGDDVMRGGDGDDQLIGEQGADVQDGGAGRDGAYYTERSNGIVADLDDAHGDDGEPGEGDSLLRVEDIYGTVANDVLTGNDGDNALYGSSGDDVISGLGGDDLLVGGASEFDGTDALDGGDNRTDAGDTCQLSLAGGTTANCETVTNG